MDIINVVSWLATVCSLGLLFTGIPIILKIYQVGNTSESSIFPFVCMFTNATLWFKYALLKGDLTLLVVNGTGICMNFAYVIIFYAYSTHKNAVHKQLLFGGSIIFPLLIYVKYYAFSVALAMQKLGIAASTFGVLSYGAPLVSMSTVLRTKNTDSMSFPMCFGNFVVAIEWTAYGYLVNDVYVMVPNVIGLVLGTVQVSLFVIYPRRRVSEIAAA